MIGAVQMVAMSPKQLLNIWCVASATENLDFFIVFNLNSF